MTQTSFLPVLLHNVLYQLPMFVVCVAGGILLLARRPQLGSGAVWALLGVGLALVVCVVMPIVSTGVQVWMMSGQQRPQQAGAIFGVLSILWALLHAASFGLLLAAVMAGKNRPVA